MCGIFEFKSLLAYKTNSKNYENKKLLICFLIKKSDFCFQI